jgi:hypothetical protein
VHGIQLPFVTNNRGEDPPQKQKDRSSDTFRSQAAAQDHDASSNLKPTTKNEYKLFPNNVPPSPTQSGALLVSALWEQGSSFLQQHLEMQRQTYQKLFAFIMYKPPVGT